MFVCFLSIRLTLQYSLTFLLLSIVYTQVSAPEIVSGMSGESEQKVVVKNKILPNYSFTDLLIFF